MAINFPLNLNSTGGTAVAPARENKMYSDREARIAALRCSVQAGTYQVDAQKLAATLLDHPSNPLSLGRGLRCERIDDSHAG